MFSKSKGTSHVAPLYIISNFFWLFELSRTLNEAQGHNVFFTHHCHCAGLRLWLLLGPRLAAHTAMGLYLARYNLFVFHSVQPAVSYSLINYILQLHVKRVPYIVKQILESLSIDIVCIFPKDKLSSLLISCGSICNMIHWRQTDRSLTLVQYIASKFRATSRWGSGYIQ